MAPHKSSPGPRPPAPPRTPRRGRERFRSLQLQSNSPVGQYLSGPLLRPMIRRPNIGRYTAASKVTELKLFVRNMPPKWSTLDIDQLLREHGDLVLINVLQANKSHTGTGRTDAVVVFSPVPRILDFISRGIVVSSKEGVRHHVTFEQSRPNPQNPVENADEEIKVSAIQFDLGVMKEEKYMLSLHSIQSTQAMPVEFGLDLRRKVVDINFGIYVAGTLQDKTSKLAQRLYKIRFNIMQMGKVIQVRNRITGQTQWVFSMEMPPQLFRKTNNIKSTHEAESTYWTDWQTWHRQTEISSTPNDGTALTQLQKDHTAVDVGRWLTYRVIFDPETSVSPAFIKLSNALNDHNVTIWSDKDIRIDAGSSSSLWGWQDNPTTVKNWGSNPSFLSGLHEMVNDSVHMPFPLRYQLEACISQGFLHECNITRPFLKALEKLPPEKATKLLEKVIDNKERFYDPMEIFNRLLPQVSLPRTKTPTHSAWVRSITVTPTTMYLNTPILETSNRVIRQYNEHQDRFLRVRFTDEKYRGKLVGGEGATMNELFTKVKRTMTNGIKIGDRVYEFLAFGNAQFREHGAYFFASTSTLTAEMIREWMGTFTHIKVVAKYCSRIGQCFSTTRALGAGAKIEKLDDVERNGFCFTDGCGKISPFLAQMIAQDCGVPNSTTEFPSAFQFRLGGCKGVLAVDPSLKTNIVQIRPSQEKFSSTRCRGLEICRISQFSAANLNVQLILVLSALGVGDSIFLAKMRAMLLAISEAMASPKRAIELLRRNIDYNHMTIQLADMVEDGFMEQKDPFTVSCLQLWRSWTIKYLKEKARLFVENGAFVLGVVDETATLKGHYDVDENPDHHQDDLKRLPEIFLQIPDQAAKGKWRVIQGLCTVARNPSLHPGDVRVVQAVDAPQLHHIRNCVVFPQTGDRDVPNMCSGGDLDGDDFIVMWDKDLMPTEWNHKAMDYKAPPPLTSDGPVTVNDMTSFFVTYMKYDNLARIAVAHRYWADYHPEGIKSAQCLELAELHSMAVDYVKTGVPAKMPKRLRVERWPHWAAAKNKSNKKIYISKKIVGKLYDHVQRVEFEPAWKLPFDIRILNAYPLNHQILEDARVAKMDYDADVRRLMAKFSIKSEFEIWTTFVLEHSDEANDYKFAETIGEAVRVLKDRHREICYEKAGTTERERDLSKIRPFVAAMYTVTANETQAAVEKSQGTKIVGGKLVDAMERTFETMPFMSFPWLFPRELTAIANPRQFPRPEPDMKHPTLDSNPPTKKRVHIDLLGDETQPDCLPEFVTSEGMIHDGDLLDLFHKDDGEDNHERAAVEPDSERLEASEQEASEQNAAITSDTIAAVYPETTTQPFEKGAAITSDTTDTVHLDTTTQSSPYQSDVEKPGTGTSPAQPPEVPENSEIMNEVEDADDEEEEGEVILDFSTQSQSAIDALVNLVGV